MNVFLLILIVIGKILLAVLLLAILLILITLFVPFRYYAEGTIEDPDTHEEFALDVIRDNSLVELRISWLWKLVQVVVCYPGTKLLEVKLFGKDIDLRKILGKKKEENSEETEDHEAESKPSIWETLPEKIENGIVKADRAVRILTGSCGRRASEKVIDRLSALNTKLLPRKWSVTGTMGLGDPYRSGKLASALAIMSPFTEEHVQVAALMEEYQFDVNAEFSGRVRLFSLLRFGVPLFFDKDCRKVVRKLRRLRSMK